MKKQPNRLEWVFLGMMVAVSTVLTVLQFRWTGDLADAELARMDGALKEQAARFEAEAARQWSETVRALSPTDEEAAGEGKAWVARLRKAGEDGARPLFRRTGLLRLKDGEAALFVPDAESGSLKSSGWGEDWETIRRRFEFKPGSIAGPPPVADPVELWVTLPLMRTRDEHLPAERLPLGDGPPDMHDSKDGRGLLILQADAEYIRTKWFPELAGRYLRFPEEFGQAIVVRSGAGAAGRELYRSAVTPKGATPVLALPITLKSRERAERGGPGGGPDLPAWTLEIYRNPGALENAVAATRGKNLLAAFLLNVLILAAGGLLVRQTRRSRRLVETQMRFVAGVSHELRTPLTVIRAAAHNIKRGIVQDPGRVAHYAGLVEDHAAQLSRMVEQVLEFSRAGKAGARQTFKPLNLDDVLRQAVSATSAETQAAHCAVEAELPPAALRVKGDGDALRHAFQNLITNAAKHGGSGGWIGITAAVTAGRDRRRIEVRVMDRGPGIPEHERAEVFKPFHRGERARNTQIRGSGLGLSLVKATIEEHGGTVRIESGTGGGAVFVVELPESDEQNS